MNIDLVIATYNRAEQLRETLCNVLEHGEGLNNIIIVNNNSTDNTQEILSEFKQKRILVFHNKVNLGAAGGKNVGLKISDADIIIVIDDDALFCSKDPINTVNRVFKENSKLGLIQFKIINYKTRKVLKYEFPGDNPDLKGNESFDIGYFIGAGHAIRKSMLEEIGYYPEDFKLYGHEEVDLSYRAINKGYIMRYIPDVAVLHKKTPSGRLSQRNVIYNMFYNRLVMTRKYLPLPYSFINNFLWFVKTTIDARSLIFAITVCRDYIYQKHSIKRDILSPYAIEYLHKNHGRLFR